VACFETLAVPRLIHRTVRDGSAILPSMTAAIDQLIAANRGWAHRIYDDDEAEDFVRSEYGGWIHAKFCRINPAYGAARPDLFRYLLLYARGGVYLDIKSTAHRPLDEVITPVDTYLLSHWRNAPGEPCSGWGLHGGLGARGEFQQWFIVAAPKRPFLEAVILQVMRRIETYEVDRHGVGALGVLAVTGALPYTQAIRPLLEVHEHPLVDITRLGFVYSIVTDQLRHSGDHYAYLDTPVIA
jgi:inositol phosphorylceramide mannosyltransferase catalytic subunit